MNTPLIAVEDTDLTLYASVEALTLNLEPPDVRDALYDVFDSDGRAIELGVETRPRSYFGGLIQGDVEHVIVKLVEAEPAHEPQLRSALIRCLAAGFGESTRPLEHMSLRQLVELAIERYGYNG